MTRLSLPEETNELFFRRATRNGWLGQQQQEREHSFRAGPVGGAGGPSNFDEWLYRQGIGSSEGKEAFSSTGSMEEGGGFAAGEAARGLVVAYWSYDYREHAMGHLTKGLLCSHQARKENNPLPLSWECYRNVNVSLFLC